ncbi:Transposon Tf2-9 poly [Paramuricea clavata]|uniref:Transposon Tf2-9 poly n=1 Tax=Paramuricea clavata TaxID=317549 RepID=A0A6S7LGI3_PARCT|nr:Transposon Tf2-9 poly [Paramuricea clavata]
MRNLNKVIKISYAQGGNLEEELNKFLTAYHTTPHGTTGKAPDEMLFKRRLRTKIPELVPFDKCDEEVCDRDAVSNRKERNMRMTRRMQNILT